MFSFIADEIIGLTAVAYAQIEPSGQIISVNVGFLQLLNKPKEQVEGFSGKHYFIQPSFEFLLAQKVDANGLLYSGMMTMGDVHGKTASLKSKLWIENNKIYLLAEHNVQELSQLNDAVINLNQAYTKSQFEITQINLKLKQREKELADSLEEIKQVNSHLKATQKKLVEAEKMASMGIMVAGMAHEINTPLGICIGTSSLLKNENQTIANSFSAQKMTKNDLEQFLQKSQQGMDLINVNLERLKQLSDSFRQQNIYQADNLKSRINFSQCITDVVSTFSSTLESRCIDIKIKCPEKLEIEGNIQDWNGIISNLISNSLYHGFNGRDCGSITLTILTSEKEMELDYQDDGLGLSSEVQEKIFDPFFTTDIQHGHGLGMHLVYNIINQKLKGTISCYSKPNAGAHFSIRVPL